MQHALQVEVCDIPLQIQVFTETLTRNLLKLHRTVSCDGNRHYNSVQIIHVTTGEKSSGEKS